MLVRRYRDKGGQACPPYPSYPPIWQISRHSASATGTTERRDWRTSASSERRGSSLISARGTGRGKGATALTSTHSQRGSSVVLSGWASAQTSTTPTIRFSFTEW